MAYHSILQGLKLWISCLHVKFGGFENLLDVLTQYDVLGLFGLVSDGKDLYLN
jgi:hypothetical protein